MVATQSSSYYDIDAILAQEELIPVKNGFKFSHLAHLDPDYVHQHHKGPSKKRTYSQQSQDYEAGENDESLDYIQQHHILPDNTRFKMPLWSIDKWSKLNYVQIYLPKQYNRKGREKLDADPASVDLRRKSERFYMSGMALINLIHACVQSFHQSNPNSSSSSSNNNPEVSFMNNLYNESQELKRTLLLTYTGERLRRTYDWTMSHIDDDVSSYTQKLTVMEERLFQRCAAASHAFTMWRLYGSRRIRVSETALKAGIMNVSNSGSGSGSGTMTPGGAMSHAKRLASSRVVSPDNEGGNGINVTNMSRKRLRSY